MAAARPPSRSIHYDTGKPDVVLLTFDEVHFFVHEKNLAAVSEVFKRMFEAGTPNSDGELPRIELAESSEVIEALLANSNAYPVRIPRLELEFPQTWELVKCAEKYQVVQALDAVKGAFVLRMSRESPPNSEHDLELLAFSLHCHFRDLEDASLRRLLEEEPPVELVKRWLTCIEAHFPVDDHDRLVELIKQHHERTSVIRLRLRQNLAESIASWHRSRSDSKPVCSCAWAPQALEQWDGSFEHPSLSQLEEYVRRAKAELDKFVVQAKEGQRECVREAGRKLDELVRELKQVGDRMLR